MCAEIEEKYKCGDFMVIKDYCNYFHEKDLTSIFDCPQFRRFGRKLVQNCGMSGCKAKQAQRS
jgi:hypothetical protein